jgi:hypothetical protein
MQCGQYLWQIQPSVVAFDDNRPLVDSVCSHLILTLCISNLGFSDRHFHLMYVTCGT